MKKTVYLAAVAAAFTFNTQAAEITPVIGLDYAYSNLDFDRSLEDLGIEKNYNSFVVSAGVKLTPYVGIEAFYQKSGEEKSNMLRNISTGETGKAKTSFYAYGADLIGYYPVFDKLELLGSLGVAQYEYEAKAFGYELEDDDLGFRLGVGLQYNVTENVGLRLMGRHVFMDDDIDEVSAGIRYNF